MPSTRVRIIFLMLILLICGTSFAAGLSPLNVLLVNDGHTMKNQSLMPADHFISVYKDALAPLPNVNVTVYNVSVAGNGPSATTMEDYDIVIWYTLDDYDSNPNSVCASTGACKTLTGNPSSPTSGGGDIENITNYLSDSNGHLFITSHRLDFGLRNTEFYKHWLGAFNPGSDIYKCTSPISCSQVAKKDIVSTLIGEDNDPVTRDSLFTATINTTLEPRTERDIFVDDCFVEISGTDYCHNQGNPLWVDDSFRWKTPGALSFYAVSVDSDASNVEEYAHSLVHVNSSSDNTAFSDYKSVYAGFGFESITSEQARRNLMNWTIGFLAGPRVDETTVRDASNTDYPHYTNGQVNISAVCKNYQIQTGTGISWAHMFVDGDKNIPNNPRNQSLGDGYNMSSTDGSYGERSEHVNYTGYDAGSKLGSDNQEGINVSFAVQCRDDTSAQYWGQFEKDWVIVDTVPPQPPNDVSFTDHYVNSSMAPITVDYSFFAPGVRADLVRFSCDQSSWSNWEVYDPTPAPGTSAPDTKQFDVNLTDSAMGCSAADGNRTVYVEGRDYANNTASTIKSDWVVLDRGRPTVQGIRPVNDSYVRLNQLLRINATDNRSGILGAGGGPGGENNSFDNGNGTVQGFIVNKSFAPGYDDGGVKSLFATIYDRALNVVTPFFSFIVDVNPPGLDRVTPGNTSHISSAQNVTLNASDDRKFAAITVFNGSVNQTFKRTGAVFSPGWSTEGEHTAMVWLNDSAGHVVKKQLRFTVDNTPPVISGSDPDNGSFILNTTRITVNVSDALSSVKTRTFNNGTVNTTFHSNTPFDPGWRTEGSHLLRIYAGDVVGNVNVSGLRFTVDKTPPVPSTNYTWNGWRETNKTVKLGVTDNYQVSGVAYCIYEQGAAACAPNTFVPGNTSIMVGCQTGNTCVKSIRYRANDSAGHLTSVSTSTNISIDRAGPSITINNPRSTVVESGVVSLETLVTDAGIGVADVNYSIVNASNLSDVLQSGDLNATDQWDASWNSSGVTAGTFIFNVTAADRFGHTTRKNVTFGVDNAAISNAIRSPVKAYVNGNISLFITARQPGLKTLVNHTYVIHAAGNASVVMNQSTITGLSGSDHTFNRTIDTTNWEDGNYTINTTAWDTSSQHATTTTWFMLDTVPPATEISSPNNASWQHGTATIHYDARDAVKNSTCSWRYQDGAGWNGNFSLACGTGSFTFDTANCNDDAGAICRVQVFAEDAAGNVNHTNRYLKVDNTPPTARFTAPSSGSWQTGDFNINRFDADNVVSPGMLTCAWRNGTGVPWITATGGCNTSFTVDVSRYCPTEGANTCQIQLRVTNPVGLQDTATRFFSIDTFKPALTGVTPANNSFIPGGTNITATFTDNVSSVAWAHENNGSHGATITSGASFDPGWESNGKRTLTLRFNDSAGNLLVKRYHYTVDISPPSAANSRFNQSTDTTFGNVRIYRNEPLRFQVNLSDNFNVSAGEATLNTSFNNLAGVNRSLMLETGNVTDGVWMFTLPDTSHVATYNVTRVYVQDAAGHPRAINTFTIFSVVNHSEAVSLNRSTHISAGSTDQLNLTVNLNRTTTPFIRVYVPPAAPGTLKTPEYTNTTPYTCSFNGTCTLSFERVNGSVAIINVSTTGVGTTLTLHSVVTVGTPSADRNDTWTSRIRRNDQEQDTRLVTPDLNISRVYCDDTTDCNVTQRKTFNLTVTVANEHTATHTGMARDLLVNVSEETGSVINETLIGDIATNTTANVTFPITINTAGPSTVKLAATDNATRHYTDHRYHRIAVADVIRPNTTDAVLGTPLVNLNKAATFTVTARDNVGVSVPIITVTQPNGSRINRSLVLSAGDRKRGRWTLNYGITGTAGTYNLSTMYVNDSSGNMLTKSLSKQFQVIRLTSTVSLNDSRFNVSSPIRIVTNVNGNVSPVSAVTANISKPRGAVETVDLTATGGRFAATYTNVSRSGRYVVNISVGAGITLRNDSQTFSVPFGTPTVKPLEGNSTHIVLPPTASTFNASWAIIPESGDLRNVTTNISIANTSIINSSDGTFTKRVGNITYEEGAAFTTYNLSVVGNGTTTLLFTATTENGVTVTANTSIIITTNITRPNVTATRETPAETNLEHSVVLRANVSDPSVLSNVSVIIQHPVNGSNATESPARMPQIGRGRYRYVFTNTNETGHYTYLVKTWDLAGNQDSLRSTSFDVSNRYTVITTPDYDTYKKGEKGIFTVAAKDAAGNPVNDFNLTLILDRDGTNTTILPFNTTDTATYQFRVQDPPTSDAGTPTAPYTLYANVSGNGNTGMDTTTFTVDRQLDVTFVSPQQGDTVTPGTAFNLTVNVTDARGNPVTEAVAFASCNTCPDDFNFLTHQGKGQYKGTLKAPSDADSASIQVRADDGRGNTESQDSGPNSAPPFISVDVGTGTGAGNQQGSGGGSTSSGGGAGGVPPPSMTITWLSPGPSLPSSTNRVNFSVRTSKSATCTYQGSSGENATPFSTTGGTLHYTNLNVTSGSGYGYTVTCQTPEGTEKQQSISFIVGAQAVSSFDLRLPSQPLRVQQGDNGTTDITIVNNGTEPIGIGLDAHVPCCSTAFVGETSGAQVRVVPGGSKVVTLKVGAPLNASVGKRNIFVSFTHRGAVREDVIPLVIEQSPRIRQYKQLQESMTGLRQRIDRYDNTGVDVSTVRTQYNELHKRLELLKRAIQQDDKSRFDQGVTQATQQHDVIVQRLNQLSFEQYVREHWLGILLTAILVYSLFFILTMVALPYYRLRIEYVKVRHRLEDAVAAREKAERQYFKREIDRDTFMEIVADRHDEVLGLRSERDRLENELSNLLRDRLSVRNVVSAPIKAVREIQAWYASRQQSNEPEDSEVSEEKEQPQDTGTGDRPQHHRREHGQQYYEHQRDDGRQK